MALVITALGIVVYCTAMYLVGALQQLQCSSQNNWVTPMKSYTYVGNKRITISEVFLPLTLTS